MSPYQKFFDKLDSTIARMTDEDFCGDDATIQDAVDLLRRSGYVLANMLNVQANTLPVLVLEPEPEVVQGESESTNDTDTPSVDEGQEAPE